MVRLYALGIATLAVMWTTVMAAHIYFYLPPLPWITDMATTLVARAAGPLREGTLPAYFEQMRTYHLEMSVYDPSGHLIASGVQPPLPPPTTEEARKALSRPVERPRAFVIVAPIRDPKDGTTLLAYGVAQSPPQVPPISSLLMELVIIVFWIGVAAFLVSRFLARPMAQIAAAARRFGQGELTARSGVSSRGDEIGDLARTFDEMSERITRLLESERELLAGVSHELRTPLARIRVALDLAAEGDAETARTSLADVAEDLAELEVLVENVLTAARLQVGQGNGAHPALTLNRTEVDVGALVERTLERMRAQYPERPFSLAAAPGASGNGGGEARLDADPVLIRRALENVLENAQKYSPRDTPVATTLTAGHEQLTIAVEDRGFGIDPADLPRVFTPFFRADRSRTRGTGGVGLGLTLAKRVVEAHGGSIDLASRVGHGTTVTFRFPRVHKFSGPLPISRPEQNIS
jgi:signal transduction histidine kinase